MASVTRVVLDTNVLVAAAYNPQSASRHVVEACLAAAWRFAESHEDVRRLGKALGHSPG